MRFLHRLWLGFRLVALGSGFCFFTLTSLSGISIASGSTFSSGLGNDCATPFDSLASTCSFSACVAGKGTVLTRLTPIASPPPPAPHPEPLLLGANTA